ncbi:hypothetical protein DMN91_005228 [Ooceraea biroi]|uniref:Uncharacterized protein n=1 Tax=Ooceraea biroi TaxID=2015173 RepID=A0A026WB79_OOCBI|nr:uncharacterized protein LOC105281082 [Ooceraea biroi]EZA53315.1 hypothetical protein X777_06394 [Ooceraea biroi]RLU22950.1 hypothetical protein DMN91_005228 [Ooceraea biroi]
MGNFASKLLFYTSGTRKEDNEVEATEQQADANDNMCTPILSERRVLVDPRSASAGIPRTPLEINTEGSMTNKVPSAIPRYLQTKQYLETDMDVVMQPLTPKKRLPKLTDSGQSSDSDGMQHYLTPNINDEKHPKMLTPIDKERYNVLGLDPRSPAADFSRTPILIPKSIAKLKARSQENLTRKGSYDTDVYNPKILYKEISVRTPQSDSDSTTVFESEAEVTVIKNLKVKDSEEKLISSEQTIAIDKEEDNVDKQDDCEDIQQDVETMHISEDSYCEQNLQSHSDKIKVWQDPSSEESKSGKEEKENVETLPPHASPREDIIITFDDTSVTLPKLVKTGENKREEIAGKKKKDIGTDAKLVSNEENIFNPGNKYRTETFKNRTPLGNRSNNEQVQRIATKSPQHLLRNKALSSKVQQENTPPCKKHSGNARNDTQWDPNCTIFI